MALLLLQLCTRRLAYLVIEIPHSYSLVAAASRQPLTIVVILHICGIQGQRRHVSFSETQKITSDNIMFRCMGLPCTKSEWVVATFLACSEEDAIAALLGAHDVLNQERVTLHFRISLFGRLACRTAYQTIRLSFSIGLRADIPLSKKK
jgi:hypothetical protein